MKNFLPSIIFKGNITMRYLFVLLVLVGCARPYGGSCDDITAMRIVDLDEVPNDYTGIAVKCVDDKIHLKAIYNNGKKNGIQSKFYSNGRLEYLYNFKDGISDGIQTNWYENGQLAYETNYIDGEIINDTVVFFSSTGEKWMKQFYNGVGWMDSAVYFKNDLIIGTHYWNEKGSYCVGDCDPFK